MKQLKEFLLDDTVRLFVILTLVMGMNILPTDLVVGLMSIGVSVLWVVLYIIIEIVEHRERLHSIRKPRHLEVLYSGKRLREEREVKKVEKVKSYFSDEELSELFNDKELDKKFDGLKDDTKFD